MGSVIPLKKYANSAYLDLKNLLGKKLSKVEIIIQTKLLYNYYTYNMIIISLLIMNKSRYLHNK